MLCCQGFEVKNYVFTLGRLAYEKLLLVQEPGTKKIFLHFFYIEDVEKMQVFYLRR